MDRDRPPPNDRTPRWAFRIAIASPVLLCAGCDMLGALFDTRMLRGIVLAVAVLAVVGFFVSRSGRR